jgi:hypothetical protein
VLVIVLFDDKEQASISVCDVLDAHGFSYQSRHTVSPFVVHAFGHTGSAAAFVQAGAMLPGAEESRVDIIAVGIDQLFPVRSRHALPELAQTVYASIAYEVGQDLPGKAADGDPEIAELAFPAEADEEFVYLNGVIPDWLCDALAQLNLLHFF